VITLSCIHYIQKINTLFLKKNLSKEGGKFLLLFSSPTITLTTKTITITIATKRATTTTTKTIAKTTITCQKMEVSFCCCFLLPLFLFFSEQQRV
jgi:hypothetical protein